MAKEATHPHRTAKVIELVGTSKRSFEDAIKTALKDASESIRDIHGAHIVSQTVKFNGGTISEYRVDMKISFGIERT